MVKIGFCFLVYDTIYNKNLWDQFFGRANASDYGIYVHPKYPMRKYDIPRKSQIISETIDTEWGDISLVKATHLLFEKAFADKCDYAILLSGDMIPLWDFTHISTNVSSSMFSVQPSNITHSQRRFNLSVYSKLHPRVKLRLPFEDFKKQNMFFCISKNDFRVIKTNNEIEGFKDCSVPDEYYFINMFKLRKLSYKSTTFIHVNDDPTRTKACDYDWNTADINGIRKKNFLFMRKIKNAVPALDHKTDALPIRLNSKYFLGLITRCKDEFYIKEFCDYYLKQGVDKIYVIDDNSADKSIYHNLTDPKVHIIYAANIIKSNYANTLYGAIRKEFTWMIYVDVDEFITTKKNIQNTIRDELQTTFANYDCVKIPWVMMACNKRRMNPQSVLLENVYRWNHDLRHPHPVRKFRCRYQGIETKSIFKNLYI